LLYFATYITLFIKNIDRESMSDEVRDSVDESEQVVKRRSAKTVFQGKDMQIVLFKVSEVNYGVDVAQVQGVLDLPEITEVPNSPYYVEGVTNLRGEVIPVIDLKKRFNISDKSSKEDLKMMVIGQGKEAVGITVDAVMEVMDIANEDIEDIPDILSNVEVDSVLGVAKQKEDLIILLDLMKMVGSTDLSFADSMTPEPDATATLDQTVSPVQ